MDSFLYDMDLRHEIVKTNVSFIQRKSQLAKEKTVSILWLFKQN